MALEVLCWNIRAPSEDRARRQARWLRKQPADVVVLTECRASKASTHLVETFERSGFSVHFTEPPGREYGVMVASRVPVRPTASVSCVDYLPSRAASLETEAGLELIALYVPSRGFDRAEKAQRKRRFLDCAERLIAGGDGQSRVVCGDLNVLEPDHSPRYRHVEEWEHGFYSRLAGYGLTDAFRHLNGAAVEHSWLGRGGDGYRYDHCFVSSDVLASVCACAYDHSPREARLSDHSAMLLQLR